MKTYTYKNTKTGETKASIETLSFELADEFFATNYWYTNNNWITVEL